MPEGISRRSLIAGTGALAIAATTSSPAHVPPLGAVRGPGRGRVVLHDAPVTGRRSWLATGGANQDWRVVGL